MRTEAAVREVMLQSFICTHCQCPLGLHNDLGCACEDQETHGPARDQDMVCKCLRTLDDFWRNPDYSTES